MLSIKVFDVCGTLYNSNTTMDFCEYRNKKVIERRMLKLSKTILGRVISKIVYAIFNYDLIRSLHIKSLRGVHKRDLEADAVDFVDFYLEDKKNQQIHDILASCNKESVMLATATIGPVAIAISNKLGGFKYISTSLNYDDNGICLGSLDSDLLGNKASFFDNNLELVVTDNKSDLALVRKAKKSIILSKRKNIKFWISNGIKVDFFI